MLWWLCVLGRPGGSLVVDSAFHLNVGLWDLEDRIRQRRLEFAPAGRQHAHKLELLARLQLYRGLSACLTVQNLALTARLDSSHLRLVELESVQYLRHLALDAAHALGQREKCLLDLLDYRRMLV